MPRPCFNAVRMATGEVFSDAEISDLLDRTVARALRAKQAAPSIGEREAIAEAAKSMTKDQVMAALIDKRLKVAAAIARGSRRARLDAMPKSMTGAQRLDAFNVGSERQGFATSSSIDAEGRAYQMGLWGQVERGLEKFPGLFDRLANPFGLPERGFDRLVAKEVARLNGDGSIEPTGDEGAVRVARVFAKALEDARQLQNRWGAWIGRVEGYVGRQSHDAGKVSGGFWRELGALADQVKTGEVDWNAARLKAQTRAFGAWRDFIMPKLDAKTFEGVDLADIDLSGLDEATREAAEAGQAGKEKVAAGLHAAGVLKDPADLKELMLYNVWADIVTGRHAELSGADDLGDFRPSASRARSVSKARVLHFTDPDAWMDYNDKYGRSSYFATIMHQLERAGRNAALMKGWGPAPEAAFLAEKQRLSAEARAGGDLGAASKLDSYMTTARFETVTGKGDTPENMRVAQVMRTIRGWEALTKLGSIVLSKSTDLPLTGLTMTRAGAGFFDAHRAFFSGVLRLGSADAKAAADALDVGARSFAGHLGSQFLSSDGPPGWTSWATRLMYKINAFEWFNNGVRAGGAEVEAAHLGHQSQFDWAHVNAGTRETMERFGITPADWETARQGLEQASDGRTYFTLDHVADADLRFKFSTMIHNILDDTVSEPRARERAGMTRGTKAGTLQGEIFRAFFQFKGFINTIVGRHLVPAASGYAGRKPVGLIAQLIIGTALAGWVSMNAKLIASGKMPHGLVGGDLGDTARIWSGALAQGGGLGLYGDFLFGEQNRFGGDFDLAQLGGPVLGEAEQVGKIVQQAVAGGDINQSTGHSPMPGELARLAGYNIPLINLWYTRLGLDYLILWRLQEAANPGYLQRYQQRVESQQGQHFYVHPTSALPR